MLVIDVLLKLSLAEVSWVARHIDGTVTLTIVSGKEEETEILVFHKSHVTYGAVALMEEQIFQVIDYCIAAV